jgi:hypothetical protein
MPYEVCVPRGEYAGSSLLDGLTLQGQAAYHTHVGARIRLTRETPAVRQAGCATIIGVVLTVLGAGALLALQSDALRPESTQWLFYVVGGSFFVVGLVLVIVAIKLSLATRLPETVVEVDRLPIRAGKPFLVTVRQTGPMRLTSLRLNLVCEQHTRRQVWRRGNRRIETDRLLIRQDNVLDLRDLTIPPGEEVVRQGEATAPKDVRLADVEGDKSIVWRLEVWGRVRGWVDFAHPFAIEVTGTVTTTGSRADDGGSAAEDRH